MMEYCEGGDLGQKIKSQKEKGTDRFDERLVVIWMAQVGKALDFCHNYSKYKILHRDIKPANVFLMADGVSCKERIEKMHSCKQKFRWRIFYSEFLDLDKSLETSAFQRNSKTHFRKLTRRLER